MAPLRGAGRACGRPVAAQRPSRLWADCGIVMIPTSPENNMEDIPSIARSNYYQKLQVTIFCAVNLHLAPKDAPCVCHYHAIHTALGVATGQKSLHVVPLHFPGCRRGSSLPLAAGPPGQLATARLGRPRRCRRASLRSAPATQRRPRPGLRHPTATQTPTAAGNARGFLRKKVRKKMSDTYRSIGGIAVYSAKIKKYAKELGDYSSPIAKEAAIQRQRELQRYLSERTSEEMRIIWRLFIEVGHEKDLQIGSDKQDGYIRYLIAVWLYRSGKLKAYKLADVREDRRQAKARDRRHHSVKDKLTLCEEEIRGMREQGLTYKQIVSELGRNHRKMFSASLPHWKTIEKFINGRF